MCVSYVQAYVRVHECLRSCAYMCVRTCERDCIHAWIRLVCDLALSLKSPVEFPKSKVSYDTSAK